MKTLAKMLPAALLVSFFFVTVPVQAGLLSGEETSWQEIEPTVFPASPERSNLIEFEVGVGARARFYLDEKSIAVGSDGVIRFVLVTESGTSGKMNMSFEGIRCESGEKRLYAAADLGGEWRKLTTGWTKLSSGTFNQPETVLSDDILCDGRTARTPMSSIVRRLKKPEHIPDGWRDHVL